jgi:hypothetical protein
MTHLIWSGRGFLVPVIVFASCLLMELTTRAVFQDNSYYQEHCWPMPLALAVAGVMCVIVGQLLSGGKARTLVDMETGEHVVLQPQRHTFFFVPVQYWCLILFVAAAATAIYQVVQGKI